MVWRHAADGGIEVLVIHRPSRCDWSLPKGKLLPRESHLEAALREVEEETGLTCEAGRELREAHYRDRKRRAKRVRYWAMTVLGGNFVVNREVDEVRWVALDRIGSVLTYDHDVRVVAALALALA